MGIAELVLTPLLIGISHSVESDHVIAVGNMVDTKESKKKWGIEALKGALWGMGHTVSTFLAGLLLLMINVKLQISETITFELFVGILLVVIGLRRLFNLSHDNNKTAGSDKKRLFFFVGLLHGLAGSGSIAVLLSSHFIDISEQFMYLLLFGFGTILGMSVVATVISRMSLLKTQYIYFFQVVVSLMSLYYGANIIYQQLM